MPALTADRNTKSRSGDQIAAPVAASTKIFEGALVARDTSGNIVNASATLGLITVGRSAEFVDNSAGAAGDLSVTYETGAFQWANSSAGDAITKAEIGDYAYVVDNQTVAKTNSNNTRPVAGIIVDVDAQGVWVKTNGHNQSRIQSIAFPDAAALNGTTPIYVVAPFDGVITDIFSVISGALATGDATLTLAIGATAVTGGVVTITQAGSAAGDQDTAAPSALNVFKKGDVLRITPGGTNSAARTAAVNLTVLT